MVTCARRFDKSLGLKGQCAGYKRLYGIKIRYAGSCKEAEKIACTFIGSVFTCKAQLTIIMSYYISFVAEPSHRPFAHSIDATG